MPVGSDVSSVNLKRNRASGKEKNRLTQQSGARVDPRRIGLAVQAFVQVQMASHAPEAARAFGSLISTRPEIISAWTLTGEADYLLRVWCSDLPALNALIHGVLLPHPAVARVQSQIVMDQFKADAPLPT